MPLTRYDDRSSDSYQWCAHDTIVCGSIVTTTRRRVRSGELARWPERAFMMTADRPGGPPVPGGADDGRTDQGHPDATLGLAGAADSPVDARGRRGAGSRADAGGDPPSSVNFRARHRPARG